MCFESDANLRKEVAWDLVLEKCARLEWLTEVTDFVCEDADISFAVPDILRDVERMLPSRGREQTFLYLRFEEDDSHILVSS